MMETDKDIRRLLDKIKCVLIVGYPILWTIIFNIFIFQKNYRLMIFSGIMLLISWGVVATILADAKYSRW